MKEVLILDFRTTQAKGAPHAHVQDSARRCGDPLPHRHGRSGLGAFGLARRLLPRPTRQWRLSPGRYADRRAPGQRNHELWKYTGRLQPAVLERLPNGAAMQSRGRSAASCPVLERPEPSLPSGDEYRRQRQDQSILQQLINPGCRPATKPRCDSIGAFD
jgi:hypothetical protein